jgi:hypothetical protein
MSGAIARGNGAEETEVVMIDISKMNRVKPILLNLRDAEYDELGSKIQSDEGVWRAAVGRHDNGIAVRKDPWEVLSIHFVDCG